MDYDRLYTEPVTTPRTWRPWTLRTPSLLAFSVLCIAIIVIIEIIVLKCSATGCHVFGALSTTRVSAESNVMYNLLPTIFSVGFSFLWALINHDVLRFEPYFQMSRETGAKAEDGLLLEYPYTFPWFVVWEAGKRRHHAVILSSITLLVTTFILTPLTSGLFDDAKLTKHLITTGTLHTLKHTPHPTPFTSDFTYTVYDYHWRNGTLPPFTTPEYALLPITLSTPVDNETWTAPTTLFEADLTCTPADDIEIWYSVDYGIGLNITSPNGLFVQVCDKSLSGIKMNSTKPTSNESYICDEFVSFLKPWTSLALVPPNADPETTLYVWASGGERPEYQPGRSPPPENITAVFCTSSYHTQSVTASFSMPGGNVSGLNRTGVRSAFPAGEGFAAVFNSSYFSGESVEAEYLDISGRPVAFGFRPPLMANVNSQLWRALCAGAESLVAEDVLDRPLQSYSCVYMENVFTLPAFALAGQTAERLGEWLDPRELGRAYEREFRMLFAVAVQGLVGEGVERVEVRREVRTRGFRVNALWARGSQGALVLVAVMAGVLAWLYGTRRCELDGEPNSLAAGLQLVTGSPELCVEMGGAEFMTQKEVRRVLRERGRRYKLVLEEGQGPRIKVVDVPKVGLRQPGVVGEVNERLGLIPKEELEPWMEKTLWTLSSVYGVSMLVFLGIVIVLLVVSFGSARVNSGLPTFGETSSFGYKFLFSYLPFIIGMAVEPLLVSVGLCHCMLGPYEALRRGNAKSSRSLAIDYDQSPPHFQLWRSIRAGNISLAALSIAILLTNVLTVALTGLFSPFTLEFTIDAQVESFRVPEFKAGFTSPAQEMYYALAGNTMTPWTTNDYYVIPFQLVNSIPVQRYNGPTFGIGADVQCQLLPPDKVYFDCIDIITESQGCSYVNSSLYPPRLVVDDPCFLSNELLPPYSVPAFDMFVTPFPNCSGKFYVAWGEQPGDAHPSSFELPYQNHMEVAALVCEAKETVYEITASVNEASHVISTTNIRQLDSKDIAAMYPANATNETYIVPSFNTIIRYGVETDNLVIFGLSWYNYLMATIDPSLIRHPQPNATHIPDTRNLESTFEEMFRRLFAVNMHLYAREVLAVGDSYRTSGTATVLRERVSVSLTMFVLSSSILLYMIVILVVLYLVQKPRIFGHVPTSLAETYALLYASNEKEYCDRSAKNPEERLVVFDGRYGYGWFKGDDGRRHFGVYRESDGGVDPNMDVLNMYDGEGDA